MSGGVDSSAAASLICEAAEGAPAVGVTMTTGFGVSDVQNCADAAAVAARLGIRHEVVDCGERFRRDVTDYFADAYRRGLTPNPCVACNRRIKFGALAEEADRLGLRYVATGHYARKGVWNGRTVLRKAADSAKDQSYVLAMLTPAQIERALFPLGEYTKAEARALAAERGFATAGKRDSQDICFIPDGDYVRFLSAEYGLSPVPGEYRNRAGETLGTHRGHLCYTIGQRKGLGISMGKHVFVLEKDAESNAVVLGDEEELFRTRVRVGGFNLQAADATRDLDGVRFSVKLRYSQRESEALVHATSEDGLVLEFAEPQRAPSPGQFAVLYSGDILVGGGAIEKDG